MADIKIKIHTSADLAALDDTRKRLMGLGESAEANAHKFAQMTRDAKESGSSGLDQTAVKAAAAAAAIAALQQVVSKSVEEFKQAQAAVVALDTALSRQGSLTDEYRERLQGLAAQLETTTAIADEKWLGVMTRLTQAGFDSTVIEQSTDAIKNLAGVVGGDIEQATLLFIKAMQGNTDGLKRYGIVLEETSDKTERFRRISEMAAQQGGGQLEARAKTLTGQLDAVGIAWNNVFENTGKWLGQNILVQGGIEYTRGAFAGLAMLLDTNIDKVGKLENATKNTATGFDAIKDASKEAADQVSEDASRALNSINKVLEGMRKDRDMRENISDTKLDTELAQIDLEEAGAPNDPVAKAQFDARRNASRRRAKFRRDESKLTGALQEQNILRNQLAQTPEGKERDALLEKFNDAGRSVTVARAELNTGGGIVARAGEAKDNRMVSDAMERQNAEHQKRMDDINEKILKAIIRRDMAEAERQKKMLQTLESRR